MPQAVPIDPKKLLEHARALATHQDGAGRPRPVWLRRAVSSAYYSAFHAVSLATTLQLAPQSSSEDRYRLSRSIDHGRLAEVCGWVRGQKGDGAGKQHVQAIVSDLRLNPAMQELATHIAELQEARHQADYDHLYVVGKAMALTHVAQASEVLKLLDKHQSDADLQSFLALVALHTQLR